MLGMRYCILIVLLLVVALLKDPELLWLISETVNIERYALYLHTCFIIAPLLWILLFPVCLFWNSDISILYQKFLFVPEVTKFSRMAL